MSFTIVDRPPRIQRLLPLAVVCLTFAASSVAQRISILTPSESDLSAEFAQAISTGLTNRKLRIDDLSLSRSAAASVKTDTPFNLAVADARRLGSVLGTRFYVLIKTGSLRRTSSQVEAYYEAFAAVYLVSSASGSLLKWDMVSLKDSSETKAQRALLTAADTAGKAIADAIESEIKVVSNPLGTIRFQPVPDDKTPGFEGLRPPMPYRRISPAYTPTANLYSVEATVEIEANVDAAGRIVSTEIIRWAGYGLDESVDETVRKMNWRPATIGTRALPMRVLLRYNFKKLEKDDDN